MTPRMCGAWLAALIGHFAGWTHAAIPHWPEPGWIWAEQWTAELSGVLVSQRDVSAASDPAEMARVLIRRWPHLNRLMVVDGQILLSGLDEANHWLARIRRDERGARASISAMTIRAAADASGNFDPASYAPASARLTSSHAEVRNGRRHTSSLIESDQSVSVVSRQLDRIVSGAGWRAERGVEDELDHLWVRAGERLHVRVLAKGAGSMLWLRHEGAP